MPHGVVKWFDPDRGFGVVARDGGGLDAVAHRSAVRGDEDRVLVVGRRVCFDVTQDITGVRADNIQPATRLCCAPAEGRGGEPVSARSQDGTPVCSAHLVSG